MSVESNLRRVPPRALGPARAIAHKAVQLATMAARANLQAVPDDSHSSLGWDNTERRFLSQPITRARGTWSVAVSLSPLNVALVRDNEPVERKALDNFTMADAVAWLDGVLAKAGLKSASDATIPYALPADADAVEAFSTNTQDTSLGALASWFDLANVLISDFAVEHGNLKPGPSPVRCWPHHFDIATYVSLEEGDFETARGIGVGMSPGDESYDQPYFYVNPWPHLKPDNLPALPAPGFWHTQGFVGAIATAEDIIELKDVSVGTREFLENAFSSGRNELGA